MLEGYDGMAVPRVLDKQRGLEELLTAPDLQDELMAVLNDLNENQFPIKRIERPDDIETIADDPPSDETLRNIKGSGTDE